MTGIKRTLVMGYIIGGIVWLVITMPTLLTQAKGNPILAVLLGIVRVVLWPVLLGRVIHTMFFAKDEEEEAKNAIT